MPIFSMTKGYSSIIVRKNTRPMVITSIDTLCKETTKITTWFNGWIIGTKKIFFFLQISDETRFWFIGHLNFCLFVIQTLLVLNQFCRKMVRREKTSNAYKQRMMWILVCLNRWFVTISKWWSKWRLGWRLCNAKTHTQTLL